LEIERLTGALGAPRRVRWRDGRPPGRGHGRTLGQRLV